jgi:hypothetical protein
VDKDAKEEEQLEDWFKRKQGSWFKVRSSTLWNLSRFSEASSLPEKGVGMEEFSSWVITEGGSRVAQTLYGVGVNGPRYLVCADSPEDLAFLVDALNKSSERL